MTKQHAKLSASRVERAMLCPGSVMLEATIAEDTNEAAERGTRIHKIMEAILTNEPILYEVDREEYNIASDYARFIDDFKLPIKVEADLTPTLSKLHPSLGGTADTIVFDKTELIVVDLKTGFVPVSATNNKQLMTYGLGAYLEHCDGMDIQSIRLVIYQPVIGIHQALITPQQLLEFQELLIKTAEMAEDPFAPLIPGAKACKYCRAKPVCPSVRKYVNETASKVFVESDIDTLLDEAALAISWAESIQDKARLLIANGGNAAGAWQLKPGRKMVSWKDKVGAEAFFAGNPLAFEIKSPSALNKLEIAIPEQYLMEKQAAPSLTKKESKLQ